MISRRERGEGVRNKSSLYLLGKIVLGCSLDQSWKQAIYFE
jgi:hypothetical protein